MTTPSQRPPTSPQPLIGRWCAGPGVLFEPAQVPADAASGGVRTYSADDLRAIDQAAEQDFAMPALLLMEHAASGLAAFVRFALLDRGVPKGSVLVCCGPGNNGGDGLAAARMLSNAGVDVRVRLLASASELRGLAQTQASMARAAGVPFELAAAPGGAPVPAIVVDAMFGTGLRRGLEGAAASMTREIADLRSRGAMVIAADVPSGLDADSGRVVGTHAVAADVTVSFAGLKRCFLELGSAEQVGGVVLVGIGVPGALLGRFGSVGQVPSGRIVDDGARDLEPAPVRTGDRGDADG